MQHYIRNEVFSKFFSKCDRVCRKLRIWLHLPRKSLMENFIFCTAKVALGSDCTAKKENAFCRSKCIATGHLSKQQCMGH